LTIETQPKEDYTRGKIKICRFGEKCHSKTGNKDCNFLHVPLKGEYVMSEEETHV